MKSTYKEARKYSTKETLEAAVISSMTLQSRTTHNRKCTVSWTDLDGQRCHVWISDDGAVEDQFYKNPPCGTEPGDAGDYNTIKLDLSAACHSAVKVAVYALVTPQSILDACAKKEQEEIDKERKKKTERAEIIRTELSEWHGECGLIAGRHTEHLTEDQLIDLSNRLRKTCYG